MLAFLAGCIEAQSTFPIEYEISFENRAHHEAEITVTFTDLTADPLELRMSRSSPGRYALHEFAKNVYDFRAVGADGRPVAAAGRRGIPIQRLPLNLTGSNRPIAV